MSMRDCLNNAGITQPEFVREIEKMYQEGIDLDGLTSAQARKRVIKRLEHTALVKERVGLMNAQAHISIRKQQAQTTNWRGKRKESLWIRGIWSSKDHQPYDDVANTQNSIMRIWQGYIENSLFELRPGWIKGAARRESRSAVAYEDDMYKAMWNEPVKSQENVKHAKAVQDLRLRMAKEVNQGRGDLGLSGYNGRGLTPLIDLEKLEQYSAEEYAKDAVAEFDLKEMFNPRTGEAFTEREALEMATENFEAKVSRGASEVDYIPGRKPDTPASIKYPDERFWVFKNSDGFRRFSKKYGSDDFMELLAHEMEASSREVAATRVLGPDYEGNWRRGIDDLRNKAGMDKIKPETIDDIVGDYEARLSRVVAKEKPAVRNAAVEIARIQRELVPVRKKVFSLRNEKRSKKYARLRELEKELHKQEDILRDNISFSKDPTQTDARLQLEQLLEEGPTLQYRVDAGDIDLVDREAKKAEYLFRYVDNSISNNGFTGAQKFGQTTRSLTSSAMLTGSTVVSITDVGTQMGNRLSNGLKRHPMIMQTMRYMAEGDRRYAVKMGLGFDRMSEHIANHTRWALDINAKKLSGKLATATLSWSGLLGWTRMQKDMLGHEIANATAEFIGTAYDKLPRALRNMYKRAGIGRLQWEKLQTVEPSLYRGNPHNPQITAMDIDKVDRDLAYRYGKMIRREQYFSTPEPDARIRSGMYGFTDGEGIKGEIMKGFLLLRSFAWTIFLDQMTMFGRNLAESGIGKAAGVLGYTIFFGTMLGGVAIWNRDIINGRLPDFERDIGDPYFWVQGLFQGTGLGIIGEIIGSLNGVSRFNRGLGHFVMGAQFGQYLKMIEHGVQFNWARLKRDLATSLPVVGTWWMRPFTSQAITDVLEAVFTPREAAKNRRFREKFWKDEFHRDRIVPEGALLPALGLDR